jgi:transposase
MECQPVNDSEGAMAVRTAIRTDLHEPEDLRRLARSEKVPRAARRMLAIANAMEGMSFADAAHVVGIERQSLGDAVQRYNAEGLAGLYDRLKPGRPRKLKPVQEDELGEAIIAGPDPERDGISAYTLDDLAEITQTRFGVSYHPGSMSRVVRRLGFTKQKARPHHPEKDEGAQALFKGAR